MTITALSTKWGNDKNFFFLSFLHQHKVLDGTSYFRHWRSKQAETLLGLDYWLVKRKRYYHNHSCIIVQTSISRSLLLSCCLQSLLKHNVSPCCDTVPKTKKQIQHSFNTLRCSCVCRQLTAVECTVTMATRYTEKTLFAVENIVSGTKSENSDAKLGRSHVVEKFFIDLLVVGGTHQSFTIVVWWLKS